MRPRCLYVQFTLPTSRKCHRYANIKHVQFLASVGAPSSEVAWGRITCYNEDSAIIVASHTDTKSFGTWPDRLCKHQVSAK